MICNPREVYNQSPVSKRWQPEDINAYATKKIWTPESIITTVCGFLNVNEYAVRSKDQRQELAYARYVCIYFMKSRTIFTATAMARQFKSRNPSQMRDHTMVRRAMTVIEGLMRSYQIVRSQIYQLEQIFD